MSKRGFGLEYKQKQWYKNKVVLEYETQGKVYTNTIRFIVSCPSYIY